MWQRGTHSFHVLRKWLLSTHVTISLLFIRLGAGRSYTHNRGPHSLKNLDESVLMDDVEVFYEAYADEEMLALRTENGIQIQVSADEQETFYKLIYEIFGNPDTIAGQIYRDLQERETSSGMTVAQMIEAGRQAAENDN